MRDMYRAPDTRLERNVDLKFLPYQFANEPGGWRSSTVTVE